MAQEVTKEQLREVYLQKYEQLNSYHVVVERHTQQFHKPNTIIGEPSKATLEWKRDGWLMSHRLYVPDLAPANLYFWKAYNGEAIRTLSYLKGQNQPHIGKIQASNHHGGYNLAASPPFAFMGLHRAAMDAEATQFTSSSSTEDILSTLSLPASKISDTYEEVNGHTCVVLEQYLSSGQVLFRAWLDPVLEYAVIKRETYLPGSTDEAAYRVTNEEFKDYGLGLYLPQVMTTESSYTTEDENGALVYRRNIFRIVELKLNPEIPPSEFNIVFPENIKIEYPDRGAVYNFVKPIVSGQKGFFRVIVCLLMILGFAAIGYSVRRSNRS